MAVSLLILGLLLALTGCGLAKPPANVPFSENGSPQYLVSVSTGETVGSGILYQADEACLYVLTAAHVLSKMTAGQEVSICFFDGWEVSCANIFFSGTSDLAMLEISAVEIPDEHRELYACAARDKESFDRLRPGDGCTALGLTNEKNCVRNEGNLLEPWIYMEDYGQYMLWADVSIQPGMSGGGLLDEKGRLIGILSGGSEDGELAAVPLSLIRHFMADMCK